MIVWYISIWDVDKPRSRWHRQSSMIRYIPRSREGNGDWTQTEMLGGRLLIKCDASAVKHAEIQADRDFIALEDTPAATDALKQMLSGLGYSTPELLEVTDLRGLIDLLTSAGWQRPLLLDGGRILGLEPIRTAAAKKLSDIDREVVG